MLARSVVPTVLALLALPVSAQEAGTPPPEEPREAGITERVEARLAQLDVTVRGPKELVAGLTRSDFTLKINRKRVTEFLVDRLCHPSRAEAGPEARPPTEAPRADGLAVDAPRLRWSTTSYLFYFDQPHLTMAGRQGAMDTARELIPRLVSGGNRAMIVSNAETVATLVPLTTSVERLLAGLDRLEHDRSQWDLYAEQESQRLANVLETIGGGLEGGIGLARTYQFDERWRQEKDLSRLAMVVGRFADLDPPKVVLYFADTMRTNAGEHYLAFFGESVLNGVLAGRMRADAFSGILTLNRVINQAAAHGIRFYTVEAQGLATPSTWIEARRVGPARAAPGLNTARIKDAQDTLVSLALETGGRAFLNGVPGSKIADRILEDLGCIYLVSFDPTGFPEDEPLRVTLRLLKPELEVQVRGLIVVQSAASKLTSRLLSAFSAPEAVGSKLPIRVGVIPIGFEADRFSGRVQVVIPGTALPGSAWDLGTSVVTEGRVHSDASGHVEVPRPGVPIVLERDMTFAPGPFELVAVAHERGSDQVVSRRVESQWPRFEESLVSLGPIAILQPAAGAFLRNGHEKDSGPLIRGETDPLRADLPTVFVGIVCRGHDQKGPLQFERRLAGATAAPFEPLEVELGKDRCAVIRDQVAERTMTEGSFRYAVRVLERGREVAEVEKKFVVLGGAGS